MILFDDETADALYAGVLAHPGDDLRRLILADRMEEIGLAEWAEFVRIGCELGRIESFVPCSLPGSRLGDGCNNSECPRCGPERESWVRSLNLFRSNFRAWYPEAVATDCYDLGFGMAGNGAEEGVRIRRGFPAEVRAPLAWLIGGLCGDCWGHGQDGSPTGHCDECDNTGRTPGRLAGLAKKWPLERVVVTDREPMPDTIPNAGSLIWWASSGQEAGSNVHPESDIPDDVFRRLTGGTVLTSGSRLFPTRAAALAALSAAILSVARATPPP